MLCSYHNNKKKKDAFPKDLPEVAKTKGKMHELKDLQSP
jgi:hypothetical protein